MNNNGHANGTADLWAWDERQGCWRNAAEEARVRGAASPSPPRLREAVDIGTLGYGGLGYPPGDPRDYLGDIFASWWGAGWGAPYGAQSQKRGEVLPVYRTEAELRIIRDRSRRLCTENEFAICALSNRQNYVVGKDGILPKASAVSAQPSPSEKELAAKVQVVLDAFAESNDLAEVQRDVMDRLDKDGEAFLRCFEGRKGLLDVRAVEPEHLRAPAGDTNDPAMSFGVETDPEDVETVLAYHVVERPWRNLTTTRVPARDILHLKLNTAKNAKRGLPTFCPVETDLRWAKDLLQSMTSLGKTRAKLAWIKQIEGAGASAANNLVNSLTSYTATEPLTGQTKNLERLDFGSIITQGKGITNEFPSMNLAADDLVALLQAVLRAIAARLNMPEWMLTADASNANLASSLVGEAPATKEFESLQHPFVRRFAESKHPRRESLAWKQVRYCVRLGVLPPETLRLIKITAEAPSLVVRDKTGEATTNKAYFDMRVKDRRTIQQEIGLEPEQVDRNFRADGIDPSKPQMPAPAPGQPNGQGNGQAPQPRPEQPSAGAGLRRMARESIDAEIGRLKEVYGEADAGAIMAAALKLLEVEDASGHQHKGKGEGGGQFTGDHSSSWSDKEPWEMTPKEWKAKQRGARSPVGVPPPTDAEKVAHREVVRRALADGKHVPQSVLDYHPDLAPENEPAGSSKGGQFTAATSAMKAAHPFPDGGPGFAVKHLRAYAANAIHRMLNEPNDPPVKMKPEAPVPKQVSLARKAIQRVEEARGDVYAVAGEHPEVVGAHAEGRQALEAARIEAKHRYDAALANATGHVAGLPEEVRAKAAKALYRATLEADERPFGSLKRKRDGA